MVVSLVIQILFLIAVSIMSLCWPKKTEFFMWAMGVSFGISGYGIVRTLLSIAATVP